MKIQTSPKTGLSANNKSEHELDVFYGLPREVKFCRSCSISNQQPMSANEYSHKKDSAKITMSFDEKGICHACRFNKLKEDGEIDWLRYIALQTRHTDRHTQCRKSHRT